MRGSGATSSSAALIVVLAAALLTLGGTLFWILVAQPSSPSTELSARKTRRMTGVVPATAVPATSAATVSASPLPASIPAPEGGSAVASGAPSLAAMVAATPTGAVADAAADPVAKTAMIAAAAANACPSPPMTLEQKELLEKAFHGQQLKVELGFFGDPSTGALASQIAYVLALDSIDAKVYGGGTIDSPAEHGLELFVRNHLTPSKRDAAILKRFAEAKIPFTTSEMPKNEDRSVDLFVFVAPNGEHCRP